MGITLPMQLQGFQFNSYEDIFTFIDHYSYELAFLNQFQKGHHNYFKLTAFRDYLYALVSTGKSGQAPNMKPEEFRHWFKMTSALLARDHKKPEWNYMHVLTGPMLEGLSSLRERILTNEDTLQDWELVRDAVKEHFIFEHDIDNSIEYQKQTAQVLTDLLNYLIRQPVSADFRLRWPLQEKLITLFDAIYLTQNKAAIFQSLIHLISNPSSPIYDEELTLLFKKPFDKILEEKAYLLVLKALGRRGSYNSLSLLHHTFTENKEKTPNTAVFFKALIKDQQYVQDNDSSEQKHNQTKDSEYRSILAFHELMANHDLWKLGSLEDVKRILNQQIPLLPLTLASCAEQLSFYPLAQTLADEIAALGQKQVLESFAEEKGDLTSSLGPYISLLNRLYPQPEDPKKQQAYLNLLTAVLPQFKISEDLQGLYKLLTLAYPQPQSIDFSVAPNLYSLLSEFEPSIFGYLIESQFIEQTPVEAASPEEKVQPQEGEYELIEVPTGVDDEVEKLYGGYGSPTFYPLDHAVLKGLLTPHHPELKKPLEEKEPNLPPLLKCFELSLEDKEAQKFNAAWRDFKATCTAETVNTLYQAHSASILQFCRIMKADAPVFLQKILAISPARFKNLQANSFFFPPRIMTLMKSLFQHYRDQVMTDNGILDWEAVWTLISITLYATKQLGPPHVEELVACLKNHKDQGANLSEFVRLCRHELAHRHFPNFASLIKSDAFYNLSLDLELSGLDQVIRELSVMQERARHFLNDGHTPDPLAYIRGNDLKQVLYMEGGEEETQLARLPGNRNDLPFLLQVYATQQEMDSSLYTLRYQHQNLQYNYIKDNSESWRETIRPYKPFYFSYFLIIHQLLRIVGFDALKLLNHYLENKDFLGLDKLLNNIALIPEDLMRFAVTIKDKPEAGRYEQADWETLLISLSILATLNLDQSMPEWEDLEEEESKGEDNLVQRTSVMAMRALFPDAEHLWKADVRAMVSKMPPGVFMKMLRSKPEFEEPLDQELYSYGLEADLQGQFSRQVARQNGVIQEKCDAAGINLNLANNYPTVMPFSFYGGQDTQVKIYARAIDLESLEIYNLDHGIQKHNYVHSVDKLTPYSDILFNRNDIGIFCHALFRTDTHQPLGLCWLRLIDAEGQIYLQVDEIRIKHDYTLSYSCDENRLAPLLLGFSALFAQAINARGLFTSWERNQSDFMRNQSDSYIWPYDKAKLEDQYNEDEEKQTADTKFSDLEGSARAAKLSKLILALDSPIHSRNSKQNTESEDEFDDQLSETSDHSSTFSL